MAYVVLILTCPISWLFSVFIVHEYERLVVFRLGQCRENGVRGPGLVIVVPFVDYYYRVDLRTVSFDVPPQEVSCQLIKDKPMPLVHLYQELFSH